MHYALGTACGPGCWSDVSARLSDYDRSHHARIKFGRLSHVDHHEVLFEMLEMLHLQLVGQGWHHWVSQPVARFSFEFE